MYSDRTPATHLTRAVREAWRVEALEARLLLSADPLTAGLMALAPAPDDGLVGIFSDPPTLLTDQTLAGTFIALPNSVRISGAVTIQATAGNANIGNEGTDYVGGHSSATTDTLLVLATGNVRFFGAVGDGTAGTDALNALTVTAGGNVTFDREVFVDGAFEIDAGGIVTFNEGITLRNGASLSITGATQIVLKGSVLLQLGLAGTPGDVLLQADEIDLTMGEELFRGTGTLTLRPETLGLPIAVLSPPGATTAGVLNLESHELRALADGFALIVIGHQGLDGRAAAGTGAVTVGGSTTSDTLSLFDPVSLYGGSITVADYSDANAMLRLGAGNALTLEAVGDITLRNEVEADALTLVSTAGAVRQQDATADNRSGEAVRTLELTVAAFTGISLPSVETNRVDAVNHGAGDMVIGINAARDTTRFDAAAIPGSVTVQRLAQTALGGANAITLSTTLGSITLAAGGPGIAIAGDGGLTLTARGVGSDLTIDAPITLVGGTVLLSAVDALRTGAAGSITASGPADITLSAGAGGLVLGAAVTSNGGTVAFISGGALDFSGVTIVAGPGGSIAIQAEGDLTVGIVEAANAITLRSLAGRIVDGLAGDAANLRGEAAAVTLEAAAGVGAAGAALRGAVGTLQASTSASGGVYFIDETALTVSGLNTAGSGSGAIVVRSTTGTLAVTGAVRAEAAGSAGHILLEALAGDLAIGAEVTALGGSISLLAAQALMLQGAVFDVRAAAGGQTLDLRAGSALTMGADVRLLTQGGAQRLEAGAALQLGRLDAAGASVSLQAGGAVTRVAGPGTDITAGSLRIAAGAGVASGATALSFSAASVAVQAGGAVFLASGATAVDSVAGGVVQRVAVDGSVSALAADAAVAGLTAAGSLVLDAAGGLAVNHAIASTAPGSARLAAAGAMALNAAVSTADGSLSLIAGGALTATATISAGGSGGLDLESGAAVSLAHRVATSGGDLRLAALGAATVEALDAGSGALNLGVASLQASGVLSGEALRLLTTAGAAGSADAPLALQVQRLAAATTGGGLFLAEADALQVVALVATDGLRVLSDGSLSGAPPVNAALAGLSSAQALLLRSGGALQVAADAPLQAASVLRLATAAGALDVASAVTAGGALSLQAAGALGLGGTLSAASADLLAGADLVMAAGASSQAASQHLQAGGSITVGQLRADGGSVALLAAGAVRDADADGDASLDISAGALWLQAGTGLGAPTNALELAVGTLAATSAAGGTYLTEADGLLVGSVSFGVDRVSASGALSSLAVGGSGLSSLGGAPLVLRSLAGDLAVEAALRSDGGVLLLDAMAGALRLAAAVDSGGGTLSLHAGAALQITSGGGIGTGGGELDVVAGGSLVMTADTRASTDGGAARLVAGGSLILGLLDAGTGAASVSAAAVLDAGGAAPDVVAASLRLVATAGGLGSSTDALDLAVGRLVARAGGDGLYLANTGTLLIDAQAASTIARVAADGSVAAVAADDALAGLGSLGTLILGSTGSLGGTVDAAVTAAGPLRLAALGAEADLALAAAVRSTGGHLSFLAGRDVLIGAAVTADGAARTVVVEAGRHLTLAAGSSVLTNGGDALLTAGGELTLSIVNVGSGHLALNATRIVDGGADGDTAVNLVGAGVRLTAGAGIGSAGNAVELQAGTLTAFAGTGGLFLADDAGLRLAAVTVAAQRVAADGSAAVVVLAAQDGLRAGGAAVLTLASGDLIVDSAVVTGALRLDAAGGKIGLNAGIAATGPVTLLAAGDIALAAAGDIDVAGSGSVDLQSGANLAMADGAAITAGSGNIRLAAAGGSLTLGSLATGGGVSLLARTIGDSGSTDLDIAAASLRVVTTGTGTTQGFGTGAKPIQLQVGRLAAEVAGTGAGGFFAVEADGLVIDTVGPLSVDRVAADGSTAAVADAALSDLVSGGNLILVSLGGDIEVREGDADDRGLSAGGNLLLDAKAGAIHLGADAVSSAGHLSLLASGEIRLDADIRLERSGRTVDVSSGAALLMAAGTSVSTVNSDLRLAAAGVLGVDRVVAGSGRVSLIGASVLETGDDAAPEVVAAGLRLFAGDAVGTESNRLEIQVGTVTARAAGGGIWLEEVDAVRVGDVAVTVQRVGATGTVSAVVDAVQSDLVTTGGNGSIALATRNGDIDLLDGSAPADGRSITADGSGRVLLTVQGPGAVLDVGNDELVQQGPVLISSDLRLQGVFVVTAGAGAGTGDGAIVIDGSVDGNPGGPADRLVLHADGAPVSITGAIGAVTPLAGLLIDGATDVDIAQPIRLTGDLTIEATGVVTLTGPITLDGGSLRIVGASRIVLGDVILASGDLVLGGDALQLDGVLRGAAGAVASFRPGTAGGSVAYGGGNGDLALDAAQLAKLAGFGTIAIGDAGTGRVVMAAGSLLDSGGRQITLQAAGDLGVARIVAGAAGVVLDSAGGTIYDSGNDRSTDVSAAWLLMRGHGPALAAGQSSTVAAIDVEAAVLDLGAAGGVTLRDSGTDGRVRYNLLEGGAVYQWLEAPATSQRAASAAPGATPAAVAEGLAALRPLAALRDAGETRRMAWQAEPREGASALYLEAITAAPAEAGGWLAQRLEQAWLLGQAGEQPVAAGGRLGATPTVELWDEALSL